MIKIIKWIILGIFIRLLVLPFTGHWDLTSLNQVAYAFFRGGAESAYEYYYAIYPPLTYIFLGLWQKIISPFLFADFHIFISEDVLTAFLNPHSFRYFFLLKLPYLFFDLAIGLILYGLIENQALKVKVFKLWLINPITLYATFSWGTIDIIPAFFVLLSTFFAHKKHGLWSVFMLGIGASFKAYPLLLLLPFCLVFYTKIKDRVVAFFIGLIPFIITILPFVTNKNFITRFFSSDQMQIIQHAGFYIGRQENISLYYIFYTFLIFFLCVRKLSRKNIPWIFFLLIFIFYAFSAFTPQWFIWGLPLLIYILVSSQFSAIYYFIILCLYFSLVLLFEVTLNIGLLAPIEVTLLDYPSLGEKINSIMAITRIDGIIRSILSGIIIWLLYLTKPRQVYENN